MTPLNPNRIKKRHTLMSDWSGAHSLGGSFPTLAVLVDDWQDLDETDEAQVELSDRVAAMVAKEKQSEPQVTKYFITISSRTSLRRLHLSGCFVKLDRCCEVLHLDEISSDDFDTICQACKSKMVLECGREENAESSGTASSSSTASEISVDNGLGLD